MEQVFEITKDDVANVFKMWHDDVVNNSEKFTHVETFDDEAALQRTNLFMEYLEKVKSIVAV